MRNISKVDDDLFHRLKTAFRSSTATGKGHKKLFCPIQQQSFQNYEYVLGIPRDLMGQLPRSIFLQMTVRCLHIFWECPLNILGNVQLGIWRND